MEESWKAPRNAHRKTPRHNCAVAKAEIKALLRSGWTANYRYPKLDGCSDTCGFFSTLISYWCWDMCCFHGPTGPERRTNFYLTAEFA